MIWYVITADPRPYKGIGLADKVLLVNLKVLRSKKVINVESRKQPIFSISWTIYVKGPNIIIILPRVRLESFIAKFHNKNNTIITPELIMKK